MLRRQISIRVELTEVTISVTEISTAFAAAPAERSLLPMTCPSCGSPLLANAREAIKALNLTAVQWKAAAVSGRLHLFCSPDHEVWICQRSMEQIKENS